MKYVFLVVVSLFFLALLSYNGLGLKVTASVLVLAGLAYLAQIGWKLATQKTVSTISIEKVRRRAYKVAKLDGATICVSGADGVGKTTQAVLLKNYLESRGLRTTIVWGRWPALTSYVPVFIGKILGLNRKVSLNPDGAKRVIHEYHKLPPLAKLWSILMLFDAITFNAVRIKLLRLWYDAVILDRFLPDVLTDIAYETDNLSLLNTYVGKAYIKIANRLAANLIFDASKDVIMKRKREVSLEEAEIRRGIYRKISTGPRTVVIDAEGNVQTIHKRVVRSLRKFFI